MGYNRFDSKKLDSKSLLIAMHNGFEVDKQIIKNWLRLKYKVEIYVKPLYVKPFCKKYIGIINFNKKDIPLGSDTKSYKEYETEDDCFYAVIAKAFELING